MNENDGEQENNTDELVEPGEFQRCLHEYFATTEESSDTVDAEDLAAFVHGEVSSADRAAIRQRIASDRESMIAYSLLIADEQQDRELTNDEPTFSASAFNHLNESDLPDFSTESNDNFTSDSAKSDLVQSTNQIKSADQPSRKYLGWAVALAAGLLIGVGFAMSAGRTGSDVEQVAMLQSEVAEGRLRTLQTEVDMAADPDEALWLGRPTQWLSLQIAGRSRGGATPQPSIDLANRQPKDATPINPEQVIWHAQLALAAGDPDQAAELLNTLPTSNRNDAWKMTRSLLLLRQSSDSTDRMDRLDELRRLADSSTRDDQVLFNLATVLLEMAAENYGTNEQMARKLASESLEHWGVLKQSKLPTSIEPLVERRLSRARQFLSLN